MKMTEIRRFSDRIGLVLLLAMLCCPARAAWAAMDAPWDPPPDPAAIPLPRSARLAAPPGAGVPDRPEADGAETARAVAGGIGAVLAGRLEDGTARLTAVAGRAGELDDAAAYYLGLGRYLAGDAAGALAALAPLLDAPGPSFLAGDARYIGLEAAARAGDSRRALELAEGWLTDAGPALAPEVWLRAAACAFDLGLVEKASAYVRHLSLTWPASDAATAGNALARRLREARPEGAAGLYDPDAPASVLVRAETMAAKGAPKAALALLTDTAGFDAGQLARADYVRGKALYRQRRFSAAGEAFARVAADNPDSSLAGWARYHEARCLWRSRDPEDIERMVALLRQVLAAPGRDDPLREVAARHLALVLAERGRFAEALDAADQSAGLAVSPKLAAQGASLAAILRYVTGDMAGAETALSAFATRFPNDAWADGARYWRGRALLSLHRPMEAAQAFREVVARRPNTYYAGRAAAALAALGDAAGPGAPAPANTSAAPAPADASVAPAPTDASVAPGPDGLSAAPEGEPSDTPAPSAPAAAPAVLSAAAGPRCPETSEPATPEATAALDKARALDAAGLPALAEMQLAFAAREMPDRADVAMAHIRAAEALGRRREVLRTAWRTFGGCLLRGSAEALEPLRQALFPRAYADLVVAALGDAAVDADIVYALIRQESFFDPKVVSGAGAVGLMQLMPATARTMGRRLGIAATRQSLFDPAVNIRLGVAFFLDRVRSAGSLSAALAGYNAGPGRAALWMRGFGELGEELFTELIPYTETRDYVRRIQTNAMLYAKLYGR